MKKLILMLPLMLMLSTVLPAGGEEVHDTLNLPVPTDEVEVFSDTTSIDSATADSLWNGEAANANQWGSNRKWHVSFRLGDLGLDLNDMLSIAFVLFSIFVAILALPIAAIGLTVYFIYKKRKEKTRRKQEERQMGEDDADGEKQTT